MTLDFQTLRRKVEDAFKLTVFSQSGCTAKEDGDGGGDEADNLEAQKDDGGEGKGDV